MNPGEVISLTEKMRKNPHVVESLESNAYAPQYLTVDVNSASANLGRVPERGEIQVPIDEQLVVEFYTRLT